MACGMLICLWLKLCMVEWAFPSGAQNPFAGSNSPVAAFQRYGSQVRHLTSTKCRKSPPFCRRANGCSHRRSARCWRFAPISLRLPHVGLTPPSRGRPAGGPPLTSNVKQSQKCLCLSAESRCHPGWHLATRRPSSAQPPQNTPASTRPISTRSKPSAAPALACFASSVRMQANMVRRLVEVVGTKMPKAPCLRLASSPSNSPVASVVPSRSCHLPAQRRSPNISVKGTLGSSRSCSPVHESTAVHRELAPHAIVGVGRSSAGDRRSVGAHRKA